MLHSFGPSELWALIDNARIAIALIIAFTITSGAVVGLIIASLESRRENKIKIPPRREPTSTLEDGIAGLLADKYGTRIK